MAQPLLYFWLPMNLLKMTVTNILSLLDSFRRIQCATRLPGIRAATIRPPLTPAPVTEFDPIGSHVLNCWGKVYRV